MREIGGILSRGFPSERFPAGTDKGPKVLFYDLHQRPQVFRDLVNLVNRTTTPTLVALGN